MTGQETDDVIDLTDPPVEDMALLAVMSDPQLLVAELARMLAPLTEQERTVIRLRFGLDRGESRTLQEVGDELGLTRQRIQQIEAKAVQKLRRPIG